ncbi:MAG TPA: hypothetical protein VFR32_08675 [Gaiellaceae bacterium]|nr:hypothetical protein [Gaiellaceae bacterium]
MTLARPGISLFGVLWLVVGVAVAAAYDYFDTVENGRQIASAILAVLLWPLLFLGIDTKVDP